MLRQLQQESGVELDSLVKSYKNIIKDYGKEKGFDYIYGTGETASVLYAKDSYDVTKDIIKIVNDKYKSADKKEEKTKIKKKKRRSNFLVLITKNAFNFEGVFCLYID